MIFMKKIHESVKIVFCIQYHLQKSAWSGTQRKKPKKFVFFYLLLSDFFIRNHILSDDNNPNDNDNILYEIAS